MQFRSTRTIVTQCTRYLGARQYFKQRKPHQRALANSPLVSLPSLPMSSPIIKDKRSLYFHTYTLNLQKTLEHQMNHVAQRDSLDCTFPNICCGTAIFLAGQEIYRFLNVFVLKIGRNPQSCSRVLVNRQVICSGFERSNENEKNKN